MRHTRLLSIPLAAAVAALFSLSCGETPTSAADLGDAKLHHRDGHGGGPGGDDGGGEGGGSGDKEGPITVVFPDDLAFDGFGIATTGTGTTDLTGQNTADGLSAEGTYSRIYDVDTSADGACPMADHPLVALFDEVELNTTNFTMKLDKKADNGSFEFNDRIRVDMNDLTHPDGDDGFVYSVWFRGKGNPEYDPANDVTITETADWTSVKVEDEDIFVKKMRCRNKKCKSVEVVERDVCELAANYSLKVSK